MRAPRLSSVVLLTITLVARSAAADGAPPIPQQPPPPPLAPRAERTEVQSMDTAGRITLGFGIFGLSLGAALGITAIVQHHNIAFDCRDSRCPPVSSDAIARYRTTGRASTISFIFGGTLAATGIGLLAGAAHLRAKPMAVTPLLGPGFAGIGGSFR